MKRTLTEVKDPVRPYRLWNPAEGKHFPHRFYSDSRRAHQAALIEARWAKVGTVVEVYDARNGHLLGQYKRTLTAVTFMR